MHPSPTSRPSWGTRIASVAPALASLAGCGAPATTPTSPAEPPRAQPAASAALAVDPSPGPHLDVLSGQTNKTTCVSVSRRAFALGQRTLTYEQLGALIPCDAGASGERPKPPHRLAHLKCPLLDPSAQCAFFSLSAGEGGGPVQARPPHPWDTFIEGQRALYAFSGEAIDRIEASGEVSTLVGKSQGVGAQINQANTKLLDLGSRLLVIQHANFYAIADRGMRVTITEWIPAASGREPGSLSLPIFPTTSASEARRFDDPGQAVLLGNVFPVALRDEASAEAWALVWVEAIAPRYGSPRGVPSPVGAGKAKHGCGSGRGSRPLTDISVRKRLHITRFDGLSRVSDKVVLTANSLRIERVEATPAGVVVNGVLYDKEGNRGATQPALAPAPAPAPAPPAAAAEGPPLVPLTADEEPLGASFDQTVGEGVVLVRASERLFFRRFDAQGRPVGEPAEHPHRFDATHVWLARAGDRWLVFDRTRMTLAALGSPAAPTPIKAGRLVAFLSGPSRARLVEKRGYQHIAVDYDRDARPVGEPTALDRDQELALPEPARVEPPEGCLLEIPTGPGTWVQACTHAPEPFRPGIKASLRLRRGEAPAKP